MSFGRRSIKFFFFCYDDISSNILDDFTWSRRHVILNGTFRMELDKRYLVVVHVWMREIIAVNVDF